MQKYSYYLNKLGYDVYLFESGSYFGGHTNTIDLDFEGQRIPIDTGFLVHNDRTYPNLINGCLLFPDRMKMNLFKFL